MFWEASMSEAQQVVQAFCDAMVERDVDAVRPLLAEDASYQNTGMPPVRGLEAILENLGGQFAMFPDSYEYRTLNIATSGDVVLTERLDMIRTPAGLQGVPVMGAFVVRDGKISRWTDYWDTALPAKMMQGEDVSALVPETY
jgi:limonene-1,2-epoxide hydrolase